MTAAAPCRAMIAITVNHVTEIIVRSVRRIARCVTPHFVWDVLMNVPHAMSRSVITVRPNARIAKRRSVRIA